LSQTLHLIAVLPDADSQDTEYVRESIPEVRLMGPFREGHRYAASSMIIQSRKEDTRTIVSHGSDLPEMTCVECVDKFGLIMAHLDAGKKTWIHFEGRVPQVTNDCVKEIQDMTKLGKKFMISIECENPERKELENSARSADVVFYSKLWAEVRRLSLNPYGHDRFTDNL
jgi:ketohexokinase